MPTAQVIIDRAAWALDRPFTYSFDPDAQSKLSVGSIVRVELRGQRVRGWVTAIETDGLHPEPLEPIKAVSGKAAVFDEQLLEMATALARYYVKPLSAFLRLFTPARVGSSREKNREPSVSKSDADSERTFLRIGPGIDSFSSYVEIIQNQLDRSKATILIAPEVREGSALVERLCERFPDETAVVHSGLDAATRSQNLWALASGRKRVALGGRAAVFVPPVGLGAVIVHSEHDRSLKEQRTPYYDARVAAMRRAESCGSSLILSSRTPSLWASRHTQLFAKVEPSRSQERESWPVVEATPRSRRLIAGRAVAAVMETHRRGERSLILLTRLRESSSGPGPEKIAEFLGRMLPTADITRADRLALGPEPGQIKKALRGDVVVGTTAALSDVGGPAFSTVVALGVDSILYRPSGRALEDAFSALWTLATLVAGKRPRGRVILETDSPSHYLIQALTRGDYELFAGKELMARRESESPPWVSLVRVTSRTDSDELGESLRELPGTTVLGPVPVERGTQYLLKVNELEAVLDLLRLVAKSSRVNVEVEPRDW